MPPPAEVLSRGVNWLPVIDHPATESIDNNAIDSGETKKLLALDLACGRAANAEWLGARGFESHAWDFSDAVINEIRSRAHSHVHMAVVRDVTAEPPAPISFDVIVVSRFLDRALCPAISAALRPQGVLFYQTFTHGLANPDYLLAENELPTLFPGLEVLDYQEPLPDKAGKAEAQLVAKRITLDV